MSNSEKYKSSAKKYDRQENRQVIEQELGEYEAVRKLENPLTHQQFESMIQNFLSQVMDTLTESTQVTRNYLTQLSLNEPHDIFSFEKYKSQLTKQLGLNETTLDYLNLASLGFEEISVPSENDKLRLSRLTNCHQSNDGDEREWHEDPWKIQSPDVRLHLELNDLARILALKFLSTYYQRQGKGGWRNSFTGELYDGDDFGGRRFNQDSHTWETGSEQNLEQMLQTVTARLKDPLYNLFALNSSQLSEFAHNQQLQQVIFTAIPYNKAIKKWQQRMPALAKSRGLLTDYFTADYDYFLAHPETIADTITRSPAEVESESGLPQAQTELFPNRPIFLADNQDDGQNPDQYLQSLQAQTPAAMEIFLAERALTEQDQDFQDFYQQNLCRRGRSSPYYYHGSRVFDFLHHFGLSRAQELLTSDDDRDTYRQISGWQILKDLEYDLSTWENGAIQANLLQAHNLQETGLWHYLTTNYSPDFSTISDDKTRHRFEREKKRQNFAHGKQMYYLAKQISQVDPATRSAKFYHHHHQISNWHRYDFNSDSNTKIVEQLKLNPGLFIALFNLDQNQTQEQEQFLSLNQITDLLDSNQPMTSLILAFDKKQHAQDLLANKYAQREDAVAGALAAWPEELRQQLTPGELALFSQKANEYLLQMPNGPIDLATWKQQQEYGFAREIAATEVEGVTDLDFKLAFIQQTPQVQDWFYRLAEKTDLQTAKSFLLQLTPTFEETEVVNWHDALYWTENLSQLENQEAKAIISSLQSADERGLFFSLLGRYHRLSDKLVTTGPILSLRELQKRVIALEAGFDFDNLAPEIAAITQAPGFNLAALKNIAKQPWFRDLTAGKLDREQPFTPSSRQFASANLAGALRLGLGERSKGVAGTALEPTKLFQALNTLLKNRAQEGKNLKIQDLLTEVPADLEAEVLALLLKHQVDVGEVVEASVHAKSDPEGWVVGNYTDCCMPFGDPKNNDYMQNPITQYFSVKHQGRIIAQSVIVAARDKRNNQDVVILDNIEVARNYGRYSQILDQAYSKFWSDYTDLPVKIGTSYLDLIPANAKIEPNYFQPKGTLSYSDSTGTQIYDLPKIREREKSPASITLANISKHEVKAISELEAEVYPEEMVMGSPHIEDILRRQRELEVPGTGASFYARAEKEIAGYVLMLPEASEFDSGTLAAHIYDLAIKQHYRGGKLLRQMLTRILESAAAHQLPIEAEARASTSYALFKNQRIQQWLAEQGWHLDREKPLEKYLGDEDFYLLHFKPMTPG